MKLQNLSVRAFLRKIVAGTLLTAALLLLIFFPIDERCACCHLRHYFDSCILHLGHGFSALFSKETFSVHRWFVPDIGSHDGQYRPAPGRL